MRMRLILLMVILVMVAAATASFGDAIVIPNNDPSKPNQIMYVVKKGDTMWDIGMRFMNDPYLWPRIWQENPQIEDPHWIYPGNVLIITPMGDAHANRIENLPVDTLHPEYAEGGEPTVVEEEAATVSWDRPTVSRNSVIFTPSQVIGFMTTEKLETTAMIHSAPVMKATFGTFDSVYVNAGENLGFQEGDLFSIVRPIADVKHPVLKSKAGFMVRTLGKLKLTKIEEKTSEADIIRSNEEIVIGDYIVPVIDFPVTVHFRDVDSMYHDNPLEGHIIISHDMKRYFGREDIVYIDKGRNQNVLPGNQFIIYNPKYTTKDPRTGESDLVPEEVIGKLVVLVVEDDFSTALITSSMREMENGEYIRSMRFFGGR